MHLTLFVYFGFRFEDQNIFTFDISVYNIFDNRSQL